MNLWAVRIRWDCRRGSGNDEAGKLRRVADPLLIEVIRFYDKLSNLERIKSRHTSVSYDLTRLTESEVDVKRGESILAEYRSSLDEVIKRIKELIPAAQSLLAKIKG